MSSQPLILVGVDFSPSSRNAMNLAGALAKRIGAKLVLVHSSNPGASIVIPELGVGAGGEWLDASRRAAQEQLARWVSDVEELGIECTGRFEFGAASRQLIDIAAQLRPLFAVVGRRGKAGLAHVLLGSVSERFVNHSCVPVLVVPEISDENVVPKRLLVGIDFSFASRAALAFASGLARRLGNGCSVRAVHCQPAPSGDTPLEPTEVSDQQGTRCEAADVARWIQREPPVGGVEVQVVTGRPEVALLEVARSKECDWLVTGHQGRTALAAFLIGSTTDRVLRLGDRPVLVVPDDEPGRTESTS